MESKDHSVSQELFSIWECSDCTVRFTQDIPAADSIGKYYKSENYISHSNTSKGIVNRLYHIVRKRTLKSKQKLISAISGISKGDLLDVGAGVGIFASHMKQQGWNVSGLEPDEDTRKRAYAQAGIVLEDTSVMFTWPAEKFDIITLWHVLEHVHDMHGYLNRLKDLLKSGGKMFIAVPNYKSYDAGYYKEFWAAYDVPIHLYHFSPSGMEMLLKKHGLRLESIWPMWYDSFYVSMLSEKYKKGSGGLIMGLLIGAISNLKALVNRKSCSSLIYVVSRSSSK